MPPHAHAGAAADAADATEALHRMLAGNAAPRAFVISDDSVAEVPDSDDDAGEPPRHAPPQRPTVEHVSDLGDKSVGDGDDGLWPTDADGVRKATNEAGVQAGTHNEVAAQVDFDAATGMLWDASFIRRPHVAVTAASSDVRFAQPALPMTALASPAAVPSPALVDALADTYRSAALALRGGFDRALATGIAADAASALARLRAAKARAERVRGMPAIMT